MAILFKKFAMTCSVQFTEIQSV